jgi:hypothetical protein
MKYSAKTEKVLLRIRNKKGLGDVVASVAQPIAGAIDKALGTNIKGCGACAKRREALNNRFPSKL